MKIRYSIKKDFTLDEEYELYIRNNPSYPHTFEFWKYWDRPQKVNLSRSTYEYMIFDTTSPFVQDLTRTLQIVYNPAFDKPLNTK